MSAEKIMQRLHNSWLRICLAIVLGAITSIFDILFHLRGEAGFVFFYFFPIFAAFFLYAFERLENFKNIHWAQWAIDAFVVILSVLRAFYELPIISGHALFLTFGFITTRRLSTRVFLLLVWFQVLYLKLFVLRDPTFLGGLMVGFVTAGLWYWINKKWGKYK